MTSSLHSLRARLLALGVFGKDVYWGLRVTLAVTVVIVTLLALPAGTFVPTGWPVTGALLYLMTVLNAYVVGLALTGDEEEGGTRVLLSRLPTVWWRVLLGKVAAGLITCVTVFAMGAIAAVAMGHGGAGAPLVRFTALLPGASQGVYAMLPLHWLAVLLTGLAAPCVLRKNSMLAAIVAGGVLLLLWSLLALFTEGSPFRPERMNATFVWADGVFSVGWSLLMATLLAMHFRAVWQAEDLWFYSAVQTRVDGFPLGPAAALAVRQLGAPLLVSFFLALVLGSLTRGDGDTAGFLLLLIPAAAALGAYSVDPAEFDRPRSFVDALPELPAVFFGIRGAALALGGFALVLTALFPMLISGGLKTSFPFAVLLAVPATAVVTGALGFMVRSRLSLAFFGFWIGTTWVFLLVQAARREELLLLGWIPFTLAVVVYAVAAFGSPLREQGEGLRGWLMAYTLTLLVVASVFVMTSPADVFILLGGTPQ